MADVATARAVLAKLGPWLRRYHGGLPAGVLAAFVSHESGGNFNAGGDASLGEVGYLQIAAYVPPLFGYPADARRDPESNIAIGSLEYALEAVRWFMKYPTLVKLGSKDNWMLSRLSFAIGGPGSRQLADKAYASHYLQPGRVYEGILRYVRSNGAPPLGSQSSAKVAARVESVPQLFAIGEAIDGAGYGPPTLVPVPPAGPYQIPARERPFFATGFPVLLAAALGGGAALLYYLWKSR